MRMFHVKHSLFKALPVSADTARRTYTKEPASMMQRATTVCPARICVTNAMFHVKHCVFLFLNRTILSKTIFKKTHIVYNHTIRKISEKEELNWEKQ